MWAQFKLTQSGMVSPRFTTRKIYAQLIRDYLQPRLGGVPLRELTVGKTQAMFTALLRANATRVHPLAPATFQRIREVLRRDEVIGLRWSDVDFTSATLTICRQVQERDGRAVICLP